MTTQSTRQAAVDAKQIEERSSSSYPEPYRAAVAGRHFRRLGDAFGLKNFGVNLVRLVPGAWSSQRHWHTHEDELVYVLEGTPTLITDSGEQAVSSINHVGICRELVDHPVLDSGDRRLLLARRRPRTSETLIPALAKHPNS